MAPESSHAGTAHSGRHAAPMHLAVFFAIAAGTEAVFAVRSPIASATVAAFPGRGRPAVVMSQSAPSSVECGVRYPVLCVFDLDACLWDKEMYEMSAIPTEDDTVLGDL